MAARVGATPVVKFISGSGDKEDQTKKDMLGDKTQASLQATWTLGAMTQVAGRQGGFPRRNVMVGDSTDDFVYRRHMWDIHTNQSPRPSPFLDHMSLPDNIQPNQK